MAIPANRDRWRAVAETEFSATARAVPAYRQLYATILRPPRHRGLFLTPYPAHCAPSQRLKFEQYYASFEAHGFAIFRERVVQPPHRLQRGAEIVVRDGIARPDPQRLLVFGDRLVRMILAGECRAQDPVCPAVAGRELLNC